MNTPPIMDYDHSRNKTFFRTVYTTQEGSELDMVLCERCFDEFPYPHTLTYVYLKPQPPLRCGMCGEKAL